MPKACVCLPLQRKFWGLCAASSRPRSTAAISKALTNFMRAVACGEGMLWLVTTWLCPTWLIGVQRGADQLECVLPLAGSSITRAGGEVWEKVQVCRKQSFVLSTAVMKQLLFSSVTQKMASFFFFFNFQQHPLYCSLWMAKVRVL